MSYKDLPTKPYAELADTCCVIVNERTVDVPGATPEQLIAFLSAPEKMTMEQKDKVFNCPHIEAKDDSPVAVGKEYTGSFGCGCCSQDLHIKVR